MQPSVESLVQLGTFPSSDDPDLVLIQKIQDLLGEIEQPISDDDARALVKLFGPDDLFGLSWTLLHAIETAPGWPLADALQGPRNEWIDLLIQRSSA